jgi:hypothetical protein
MILLVAPRASLQPAAAHPSLLLPAAPCSSFLFSCVGEASAGPGLVDADVVLDLGECLGSCSASVPTLGEASGEDEAVPTLGEGSASGEPREESGRSPTLANEAPHPI